MGYAPDNKRGTVPSALAKDLKLPHASLHTFMATVGGSTGKEVSTDEELALEEATRGGGA